MAAQLTKYSNVFDFLKEQISLPFTARLAIRYAARVTVRQLKCDTTIATKDLPDHLLKDIGVTPNTLADIATHQFIHPRF